MLNFDDIIRAHFDFPSFRLQGRKDVLKFSFDFQEPNQAFGGGRRL